MGSTSIRVEPAFRERWNIEDDPRPLGSKGAALSIEALNQRRLAQAAVNAAMRATHATGTQRAATGIVAADITLNRKPEL